MTESGWDMHKRNKKRQSTLNWSPKLESPPLVRRAEVNEHRKRHDEEKPNEGHDAVIGPLELNLAEQGEPLFLVLC